MEPITTSKLTIVDSEGIERLRLGVTPSGHSHISLTNKQGESRMVLTVSEDEHGDRAFFSLRGHKGGPEVRLIASEDGSTEISLMRKQDQPLILLSVHPEADSRPCLTLFDPSEERDTDDSGNLSSFPTPLAQLTLNDDHEPYLAFWTREQGFVARYPYHRPRPRGNILIFPTV